MDGRRKKASRSHAPFLKFQRGGCGGGEFAESAIGGNNAGRRDIDFASTLAFGESVCLLSSLSEAKACAFLSLSLSLPARTHPLIWLTGPPNGH
jgi:hypothetical protein